MLRTAIITLIAALSPALTLTISIEQHRLQSERVRFAAAALQATTTAAMRDSTIDVASTNRRIATLLGDSLRLVKKQVVQVTQTRDYLGSA